MIRREGACQPWLGTCLLLSCGGLWGCESLAGIDDRQYLEAKGAVDWSATCAPDGAPLWVDAFDDGMTDESRWRATEGGGSIVEDADVQALVASASVGGNSFAFYETRDFQSFHDTVACVQVETTTPSNGATYLNASSGALYVGAAVLQQSLSLGTATDRMTGPPFDPVEHAWWRLRFEDEMYVFDTSPDGATWTEQLRHPGPQDLEVEYLYVDVGVAQLGESGLLRSRFRSFTMASKY